MNKVDNPQGNQYFTGTIKVVKTYKEGMPNGLWSYASNFKRRSKVYMHGSYSWSAYEQSNPESITVTYKDGMLVGKIDIKQDFKVLTGQIDNNGYFTGTWKIDDAKPKEFISGVLQETGKDAELNNLYTQYLQLNPEEQEAFCKKHRIEVKTRTGDNYFNLNDGYFDNTAWLQRNIGGDKCFPKDEYGNHSDTKNYGKYIVINRIPFTSIHSIPEYQSSSRTATTLTKAYEAYKDDLSPEDQQKLLDLINELRTEETATIRHKEQYDLVCSNYRLALNTIGSLSFKYVSTPDIVDNYNQALKQFGTSIPQLTAGIQLWINDISPILKKISSNIIAKYDFTNLGLEQIGKATSKYDKLIDYSLYVEASQKALDYVKQTSDDNVLWKDLNNKSTAICELHDKICSYKGITDKKVLYSAYNQIFDSMIALLKNASNINDAVRIVSDMDAFTKKIDTYSSVDTKELEKSLRKLKTTDEKKEMLLK